MSRLVVSARPSTGAAGRSKAGEVERFDIHQRIQHLVMMASFIILALTGLPQKFSTLDISQWSIALLGGIDNARLIHRSAGLIMLADGLYHLAYLAYGTLVDKKRFPLSMLPSSKDVLDFLHQMEYYFGRRPDRPQFGRFNYLEKFEYWAVYYGLPLMGGTGLILMFAVTAARFLPSEAIPGSLMVHSNQAVLEVLWLGIVHVYFILLRPRAFRMNGAMFVGKIPRHFYAEEHPLELAALEGRRDGGDHHRRGDGAESGRGRNTIGA